MTDIADDAGLSVGALYRYFNGKEELIREVVAAIQDTERALADIPEDADDLLGALQRAVSRMIEVLDEPWAEAAMRLSARVPGEALDDPVLAEHVRSTNRALTRRIEELLERAAAAGRLRAGVEPASVSAVLASTIRGAAFQRLVEPGLDLGAYAAGVRALLEGCRP